MPLGATKLCTFQFLAISNTNKTVKYIFYEAAIAKTCNVGKRLPAVCCGKVVTIGIVLGYT